MDDFQIKSPYRVLPPNHFTGFSELKTDTFDKNIGLFDDIEKYNELLSISERYLDSKMLDPRIESLQRLVEPLSYLSPSIHARLSKQFDKPVFEYKNIRSYSLDDTPIHDIKYTEDNIDIDYTEDNKKTLLRDDLSEQIYRVSTDKAGGTKKRIVIPTDAYDENVDKRIILRIITKENEETFGTFLSDNLDKVEENIDNFIKKCHLHDVNLISPTTFEEFLNDIKPPGLKTDLFNIWCLKPIGMHPYDYLEVLTSDDNVYSRLLSFIKEEMISMGHTLDREKQVFTTLKNLSQVYTKFEKEEILYTNILEKMKDNFNNQYKDILQCTRQDLRLSIGHAYAQWGRIRNVIDWKPGDKIIREMGFAQELEERNRKKLEVLIKDVLDEDVSDYPNLLVKGQHMYFRKGINDSEAQEMEWKRLQITRDRQQVLAEFSSQVPSYCPKHCVPWKCVGVSKNNIIWKMFNTNEYKPVIVKYRTLKEHSKHISEIFMTNTHSALKILGRNFRNAQRNIIVDIKCEIHDNKIIKTTPYISDCPLSSMIENSEIGSPDLIKKIKLIIHQLISTIANLELKFLLPLKPSKIYFKSGRVILDPGLPLALLDSTLSRFLEEKTLPTIASELWDRPIQLYLPPEANGRMDFTNQPEKISKAHAYMIGKIFEEAVGGAKDVHIKGFLKACLEPDPTLRPTLKMLKKFNVFKSINTNYGPITGFDVPKVKCAVEVFGDIATIVNNKIKNNEKGVADYEALSI